MLINIENEFLSLTVDTLGAQMMSLKAGDTEYLWQGDPQYWRGRAPVLFPYVARLWASSYCYRGKTYTMGIHGFASKMEFSLKEQGKDFMVMSLTDNEETRAMYPFEFTLDITYRLVKNCVEVSNNVRNHGQEIMHFGFGGHPGFRVPVEEGEAFEDYCLEFPAPCKPDRVGFTSEVYLNGIDTPYPLEDDQRIWLRHDLFDTDAVVLKNMCREVTLKSKNGQNAVTVSYPGMGYVGFWHMSKMDAPYVCIEPWTSLPARHNVVEDLEHKSDLIHLQPGKTYDNTWTITIGGNKK